MKLAVVADVHVGNFAFGAGEYHVGLNARCRATLAALRRAVEVAQERDARLVVAGDLFHGKRPEPAVIAAVQEVLRAALDPVLLLGNHDAIGPGDHALAPLRPVARIAAEGAYLLDGVLYVPWSPGSALERLDAALLAHTDERVLVMHCGLYDSTFPAWLCGPGAVEVGALHARMDAHGIRFALAGDYHQHRAWRSPAVLPSDCHHALQVGALCPTGFSDAGLDGYGSVILVDLGMGEVERVEVPGPRFLSMGYAEAGREERVCACREAGNVAHVRLRVPAGQEVAAEKGTFCSWLRAEEVPHEVVPEEAEPRASGAAELFPQDFDAALREYVEGMKLDEKVDRVAVLTKARSYYL